MALLAEPKQIRSRKHHVNGEEGLDLLFVKKAARP
jgi:hypothetical protein